MTKVVYVSESHFSGVPPRAIVAFVARCARRLQPFLVMANYGSDALSGMREAGDILAEMEHIAIGRHSNITKQKLVNDVVKLAKGKEATSYPPVVANAIAQSYGHDGAWRGFRNVIKASDVPKCIRLALSATAAVLDAERVAPDPDVAFDMTQHPLRTAREQQESDAHLVEAVSYAVRVAQLTASHVDVGLLLGDLAILREASYPWKVFSGTPVPDSLLPGSSADVFALYSSFEEGIDRNPFLIEVVPQISRKVVDNLALHPNRLFDLSPRAFEELIAEIFNGFGFEVHLTARTRDGGKDVVAVTYSPARLMYLIECKRYARQRTVGIEVIRSLHGVTISDGANKGILATTGKLSADVRKYLDGPSTRWLLEGRDYEGIVNWLRHYQTVQIEHFVRASQEGHDLPNKSDAGDG